MRNQPPDTQVEELMPRISIAVIVACTVIGVILAIVIDAGLPSFNKTLIAGSVLLVAISNLLAARLVVMPSLVREATVPRAHLITVGHSEAMANGAFAVGTAIFVNEWWLPLAFGALGLLAWLLVCDFVQTLPIHSGRT